MPGNEPMCILTGAEKRYGVSAPVLGPLDLTLRAGEALGVRGPNGAGKSTLLAMMAGVLRPDAGSCVRSAAALSRTGYVPQDLSLYESLTARDNLRFWALACGMPAKATAIRTKWLLEQLELTGRERQSVSAFSGGMKRRLHLATALMFPPALLLLDEPTVGADSHSAGLILAMIARLRDAGCAIALVSHRDGDLEQVCTRILTLEAGRLVREETRP